MAEAKFKAAVPDVQQIATGSCNCCAKPIAKNAAQRSSTIL